MPKNQEKKKGLLTVTFDGGGALTFEVWIKDSKPAFGKTNYLVTPVAGSGEAWKSETNIQFI